MGSRGVRPDGDAEQAPDGLRRVIGRCVSATLNAGLAADEAQAQQLGHRKAFDIYRGLDLGEGGYAAAPARQAATAVAQLIGRKDQRCPLTATDPMVTPSHPVNHETDMLQELDHLPTGLLETDARDLARVLGGPTLIHLPGGRQPPLFVSVLLHGNETVGWDAVRALLADRIARYGDPRLPRALSLFIGNVTAAASGVRRLPDQPDYNRIWPGGTLPQSAETALASLVLARMAARGVFASIDLHNNTGANPHYACVDRLDCRSLQLATLFTRTVVYLTGPTGVQSLAFADLCPTVTLECGKVGEAAGVAHARSLVDAALHLAQLADHPVAPQDIDLFHSIARVLVPSALSLEVAPAAADLMLDPELERLNFRELPRGTAFARLRDPALGIGFQVLDAVGHNIADRFFHVADGEVRLHRPVMPAMLTRDLAVIRQDCLGYLMERYADQVPGREN